MPRLAPVTTATGSWDRAGVVTAQSPPDCREETHVAYLATAASSQKTNPQSTPIMRNGPGRLSPADFSRLSQVSQSPSMSTLVTRGNDEQAGKHVERCRARGCAGCGARSSAGRPADNEGRRVAGT